MESKVICQEKIYNKINPAITIKSKTATIATPINTGDVDFSGMTIFPSLESLDLMGNNVISTLSSLPVFPQLESIRLESFGSLDSLDGLAAQSQLTQLDIQSCEGLVSLNGAGHLANLDELTIYNNPNLLYMLALSLNSVMHLTSQFNNVSGVHL